MYVLTVGVFLTCVWGFDEVHDDRVGSFSVHSDLIRQRMSNHHRHAFPSGVKSQRVQQLKAQLPQVRQLHGHLVREAPHQGAFVGSRSVNQSCLIGGLSFISQLPLLHVPGLSVVAGRYSAEGVLQAAMTLLLVQFGECALCRRGGQHAGAIFVGGAVGDEAGGAAAVGAGCKTTRGETFDKILNRFNGGLQLEPHPDLRDRRQSQLHLQQQPVSED